MFSLLLKDLISDFIFTLPQYKTCCQTITKARNWDLSYKSARNISVNNDKGIHFLTNQCLKDQIISVLIHCRQNMSHTAGLCEIIVTIFEISYTRRSASWRSKLSDNVGFLRVLTMESCIHESVFVQCYM